MTVLTSHGVYLLVTLLAAAAGARLAFLGQQPFRAYVSRATLPGRTFYQLFAVDMQTGSSNGISYTTVEGWPAFFFNSTSGLLVTAETLPQSGPSEYTLVIEARLSAQMTATANISIIVIQESDTTPRFEHSQYQASISESLPVSTWFTVIRAFSLVKRSITQHYILIGGNTNNSFAINSSTGVLRVNMALDRERTSSYSLTVRYIEDVASIDVSVMVTIQDENDNAPQFAQMLYNISIREDVTVRSSVVSASATDPDFAENGMVSYVLDGGGNSDFELNPSTGEIRTVVPLDYERQFQYQLQVTAFDGGSPSLSTTVTILVNLMNVDDECPRFENPVFFPEIPDRPIRTVGMVIVNVAAYDPDGFSNVTYAVISGDEDGLFSLNSTTGAITLARVGPALGGQYTLNVSASDLTCINETFAPVEIRIENANNHTPRFVTPCRAELEENPPINTQVITLVAMDDDLNDPVTYSLVSHTSLFDIDNNGVVRTATSPEMYDRESQDQFQVGVIASDRGNRQDYCLLVITLLDQNDNAPTFQFPQYNETKPFSLMAGSNVTRVHAEDMDLGQNGTVWYSLRYPDTSADQPFTIDSQTGFITTNKTLSQNISLYHLMVVARDNGTHPMSSTATVTVTISDTNFPMFEQPVYSASICEGIPADTTVVSVRATSSTPGFIIYRVLRGTEYRSNRDGNFQTSRQAVAPNQNVPITVSSQVNYEMLTPYTSFVFLVSAEDFVGSSRAQVEVVVEDRDDNDPEFASTVFDYSIPERMPIGTIVGQLQASDADSGLNGEVAFRLSSISRLNSNFSVDRDGIVRSLRVFDADTMSSRQELIYVEAYNPNVGMMLPCGRVRNTTASALVRVTIMDLNDNPPSFTQNAYILTIPENQTVLSRVFRLEALDGDTSDLIYFSIFGGNDEETFAVNGSYLILARRLDFERTMSYVLSVQVTDGVGFNSATINIHVSNIDDEPPVFNATMYYGSVVENAANGTFVLTVTAQDPDSTSIAYSLQGLVRRWFTVDGNGVITVAGQLDREAFPAGEIVFLVFAYGGGLATAQVRVNISDLNDYPPRFLEPFTGRVQENVPGSEGLFVGVVQAVDLDEGRNGTVTYSLLSGESQGFRIDSSTGTITAHRTFDREAKLFYVLTVQAVDDGIPNQLSSTLDITVEIGDENDNKPSFTYPYMFAWLFEDSPIGTTVLSISGFDPDNSTNASLSYRLTSSNPAEMKYDVIPSTGEVVVTGILDYEIPQHRVYNLTISLSDPMLQSDFQGHLEIHLLDQNDNPPIISVRYTFGSQLTETLPAGTPVATVTANDIDSDPNQELVYSISAGNTGGDFRISDEGLIQTVRELDHERTPWYTLTVMVSDQGDPPMSTTYNLNFNVTDINDEPPMFDEDPYMGSIPENSGSLRSVLKVSAHDPDSGTGGEIGSYFILAGDEGNQFQLSSTSGLLRSRQSFDREIRSQYTLTIAAMDRGSPPLTGTTTAIITISDVNDNPSSDGGRTQVFIYALEGHFAAGSIAPVYFSDPDSDDTFQDCLLTPQTPPQGMFSVDQQTCILRLTQDDPAEGNYVLQIRGTDGRHGTVGATVDITVTNISVPLENTLTITINASAQTYIDNLTLTFPAEVTRVLGTSVTVVSVDEGYHNRANTVDISFYARNDDGSFLNLTAMSQYLYLQRDSLRVGDYSIYALPTDPCTSEPCFNEGACRNIRTLLQSQVVASTRQSILVSPLVQLGYQCDCIPGTTGEHCEINFDDCYSSPCLHGAPCSDGVQGFTCDCPQGTSGHNCGLNPDECASDPCQNGATCRNGLGSPICDCPPGYYGDVCQHRYFRRSSVCDSSPCLNGGECSPGQDSYTCVCPRNFTGPSCEQSVLVHGGCVGNPCYNGSTCTNTPGGPVCTCSVGFTGPFCRWPLDSCELEPCRNGGTCLRGFYSSYLCVCTPGYTGENCTQRIPACSSSPCLNGGRCSDMVDGSYTCECTRQYYGDNCQFPVQPRDLCAPDPCSPAGNCTHGRDSHTCTCNSTSSGDSCSMSSPPATPCGSNPCLHGSSCTDSANSSYACSCSPGFSGTNCEIDVDDCESSPCTNGGTCIDGVNGFICDCAEQITGQQCEIFCPDRQRGEFCETTAQFCVPQVCMNGGTCIEEANGFRCLCPPTHTGERCERENNCTVNQCLNRGTCVNSPSGGFNCLCHGDFDGERCELLTASFYGSQTESSYRAFDSLDIRGWGNLSFQFATRNSSGLLLYNTQFQEGVSRDYIAVEVVGGHLSLGVSQGGDSVSAVVMSSAVQVNDGRWHQVSIETRGKTVRVSLDHCLLLEAGLLSYADCSTTASTQGDRRPLRVRGLGMRLRVQLYETRCLAHSLLPSFLDLGLPLWVGGVPFSPAPTHPVSSRGITGCVAQLRVNGRLLDMESFVLQERSQRRCPQLEDACATSTCGAGTCVPVWGGSHCVCPPQMSGEQCNHAAESLTFDGGSYAQYTVGLNPGAQRRRRQQTTLGLNPGAQRRRRQQTTLRSTYEERLSLWFRKEEGGGGLLFQMGSVDSGDVASIQLESGEVVYHINIGSGDQTLRASGVQVEDAQWHMVDVHRSGLAVSLTIDNNSTFNLILNGTALTLDVGTSQIFAGGRPTIDGRVSGGFTGCLQDIRVDQFTLPTSGSNDFGTVTFRGSGGVVQGCVLGPCFPNPCGPGNCSEIDRTSFACRCLDGTVLRGRSCPELPPPPTGILPIAVSVGGGVLVLAVLVTAVSLCCWKRKQHKQEHQYPINNSQTKEMDILGRQCLVISNEPGGGEQDTSMDWSNVHVSRKNFHPSPSSSTATVPKNAQIGSPVDRANSPVIHSFIMEQVESADKNLQNKTERESVKEFGEEGGGSDAGSLSSICASLDEEEYTIERLRDAGPKFEGMTELLENLLTSERGSVIDSGSEVSPTKH